MPPSSTATSRPTKRICAIARRGCASIRRASMKPKGMTELPAKARARRLAPLVAALGLAACQQPACEVDDPGCNELANKPEWSVLQAYEQDLRSAPHERPFVRIENALGSGLTVLAFPRRDGPSGYVVLLENAAVA